MPPKATLQDFIQKSKNAFSENAFDYSLCNYINNSTNVVLICNIPLHGSFEVTPQNHTNKHSGCPLCSNRITNTEHFKIKSYEIHGDLYNYDKVVFTGAKKPVTITCRVHGDFSQRAENHYNQHMANGCPSCANNINLTTAQFIERAQAANSINGIPFYDYSNVVYVNSATPINVICSEHGIFSVIPDNHLNKHSGCPACYNKTEGIIYNALRPIYPDIEHGFPQEWCKRERCLPFDFCIPKHNIIIELDGPHHFRQTSNWNRPPNEVQSTDKFKMQCANQNGYSVIRLLQEDVYYNKINWLQSIKDAIVLILNFRNVPAIDCSLETSPPNANNLFLNKNIYICSHNEYEPYMVDADPLINVIHVVSNL